MVVIEKQQSEPGSYEPRMIQQIEGQKMKNNHTVSMIDHALKRHNPRAGPLFVVVRHGHIKKSFSRDIAIRYLAFFMTIWAFETSGVRYRPPDVKVSPPVHGEARKNGAVRKEYRFSHQRCRHLLRRILYRKREALSWQKKYDAWVTLVTN